MLKYLFVIALALPVYVFADKNKTEAWTLDPTCETNENVNSSFTYFMNNLTSFVQKKDSVALEKLNETAKAFITVINETCAGGKLPNTTDLSFFIEYYYGVKNGSYDDFVKSNGTSCVKAIKNDINKCLNEYVGSSKDNSPNKPQTATNSSDHVGTGLNNNSTTASVHGVPRNGTNNTDNVTHIVPQAKQLSRLINKLSLQIDKYACNVTGKIQKCVVAAITNNAAHNGTCTTKHANIVNSLFDFSVKRCQSLSFAENKSNKQNGTKSINPVIIILPVVAITLLIGAIIYKKRDLISKK